MEGNPRLCMASAVGGYVSTYGKDEPMGCYEDIDHADLMLLVGSNAAEAHPILFERMARRKQTGRDVKIVVLDPRITPTSRIADLHLSFTPGTDLAILNAMAHVLVAEGLVDEEFVKAHVAFGEGKEPGKSWADYVAFLAEYTPARAAEISGARADDIVTAARWFGEKGRTAMSMWTMGLNQRTRGVWANNLVHNLHLVTGKIGVPGSTPLSLTGQPNACGGVRDGGALAPAALRPPRREREAPRGDGEALGRAGRHDPTGERAADDGPVQGARGRKLRALYVMTTNPGQSLPNVDRWRKALEERGAFLVVAEAFHPTRTSELADVVLPAALAEKEGVYGCTERRYQLLEQAVKPAGAARGDFEILCELARRLGHGRLLPWRKPAEAGGDPDALGRRTTSAA